MDEKSLETNCLFCQGTDGLKVSYWPFVKLSLSSVSSVATQFHP